jgi:hypothetical protein
MLSWRHYRHLPRPKIRLPPTRKGAVRYLRQSCAQFMKTVLGLGITAQRTLLRPITGSSRGSTPTRLTPRDLGRSMTTDAFALMPPGMASRATATQRGLASSTGPKTKIFISGHFPMANGSSSVIFPRSGDEIKSLQLGDQVSENYQKNKAYLAEHKDSIGDEAAKARYLTAKELTSMYAGQTWQWDNNGAAYFAPNRTLIAWANNGIKAAYADGSWSASDQGRFCSNTTWHGRSGNAQSVTCWETRIDEKTIYQRKLPDGKWYILAHFPARTDDGIQKLEPGDHVSGSYQRNKRYVVEAGDGKEKNSECAVKNKRADHPGRPAHD